MEKRYRKREREREVHLYCSAQMSMFNMEKRYRNKIIIIIIIIIINCHNIPLFCSTLQRDGPCGGSCLLFPDSYQTVQDFSTPFFRSVFRSERETAA